MIVDTTRSSRDTTGGYPPLILRRLTARAIDSVIAVALACLIVLPFTLSQVTDALLLGGFDSLRDFLTEWDPGTVAGCSVGAAVEALQPVVLSTVYLQALVIWAYDWVGHALTGASIGKGIARVRVTRHRDRTQPTISPDVPGRGPWPTHVLRMGLRSGLVVVPATLAAGMSLAAAFAVPGAVDLAELFIALSVVMLIAWAAGGVGLHGLVTGTRVVGFEWQELKQVAEQQIEFHTGHADDYLHRLQEAARTPGAQQMVRDAEHDPRSRSALTQGSSAAQQAEQRGLRSREDAAVAVRQVGEAFRTKGLRGVLESFMRSTRGQGGV